ncbi:LCP family protein [Haloimpatiens lingqiaonensis]|uniref:LCP family protein n=1 Tax=Haloimpatiens lingqiaonensis TaxID=1380675 RepID=UPI001FA9D0BD|nr:LCP family protein [Haloimpatiens lingqiaonensis]
MKKKSKAFKIISTIILVSLLFLGGVFGYIYSRIKNVKKVDLVKDPVQLSVNEEADRKSKLKGITNIAFFGIDTREEGGTGRSDSIMIVTLDGKNNKIKVSSIMRDTYVDIEGHGKTKLNHAYAYGGPALAIKTLNKNFDLNIKDFATVDFFELASIIDDLGGVEINVESDEVKFINSYSKEVERINKKPVEKIQSPGKQTLSGAQAVAYCRIRYTSGGDYRRTERQRTVLNAIINKSLKMNKKDLLGIIPEMASKVQTSMSTGEIMKLATEVITSNITYVEQKRFPFEEHSEGKMINGIWYLVTDIPATKRVIRDFIFQ